MVHLNSWQRYVKSETKGKSGKRVPSLKAVARKYRKACKNKNPAKRPAACNPKRHVSSKRRSAPKRHVSSKRPTRRSSRYGWQYPPLDQMMGPTMRDVAFGWQYPQLSQMMGPVMHK